MKRSLSNEEFFVKTEFIVETSPCGQFIRFDEEIGKGSSKIVYKAIDTFNMREVVWNSINVEKMKIAEKRRLLVEVELLRDIKHENIMKIYGSWFHRIKKEVVFITEYISGGSLRNFITKHKEFKTEHIKNWCIQILKGLEYLHKNKIIHRDLKCDNIFIHGDTADVCIGDFGCSTKSLSNVKTCIGTPEFMAPEVYNGEYSESVDMYSFGMCLLEMFTGEIPYLECDNICKIYKRVTNGILPECLERVKDVEIKKIIIQLLDKDKETRPSASELLNNSLFRSIYISEVKSENAQNDDYFVDI